MHDSNIQKSLKKDMLGAKIEDTKKCNSCRVPRPEKIKSGDSIHMEIVDETDEYLGTISLRDIDLENMTAEYDITTRTKAHGKGFAFRATGLY